MQASGLVRVAAFLTCLHPAYARADAVTRPAPLPRKTPRPPPLPPRATLLIVGDSLVGGPFAFAKAVRERLRQARVRVVQDTWVSVGISKFAYDGRLRTLIAQHRPTHVFIVLGTNDYLIPSPERLVRPTERIVARVAASVARPGGGEPLEPVRCAWIGPFHREDTGVVAMLAAHVSPCAFVDSRRHGVPTSRDGFHPSSAGAYVWADGVLGDLAAAGWSWRHGHDAE